MKDYFKTKVSILFGYNGLPYKGLQYLKNDPQYNTIEKELEQVMHELQLISDQNFGDLHKVAWQRASRTDKGVHALSNVVSLKVQISEKYLYENSQLGDYDKKNHINRQKIIDDLNEKLSENVKVFAIKLVPRSFDSKLQARSRNYEYVAPIEIFQKENEDKQTILANIKNVCQHYIGTKKYHNFSKNIKYDDGNAKRIIMDFTPVDIEINGKTFILFKIWGQSFVYHQIRKMIGMIIQSIQKEGYQFYQYAFQDAQQFLWLAPAEGLYLRQVNFDEYNKKQDITEKIILNEDEDLIREQFRDKVILPLIYKSSHEDMVFKNWLQTNLESEVVQSDSDYCKDEM